MEITNKQIIDSVNNVENNIEVYNAVKYVEDEAERNCNFPKSHRKYWSKKDWAIFCREVKRLIEQM